MVGIIVGTMVASEMKRTNSQKVNKVEVDFVEICEVHVPKKILQFLYYSKLLTTEGLIAKTCFVISLFPIIEKLIN